MPAKGFLTQAEKERLQKSMREDDSPQFRCRDLMLLLMNDGKTYDQNASYHKRKDVTEKIQQEF